VVAAAGPSEVTISVIDDGVGIDAADYVHVFEEFRQVGNPADRQPGTGLGLALSKRLVEAHGGRIELESVPGKGSRFTVFIPQADTELARPAVAAARESNGAARLPKVPAAASADPIAEVPSIEDNPKAGRLLRTMLAGN